MSIAEKLIRRDLEKLKTDLENSSIIFVDLIDDNLLHLEAAIQGPMSTPYENGVFLIDIKLTEQFPFSSPQSIIFKRATMHPNVTENGTFLSDLLTKAKWVPTWSIKDILEHVWARLAFPDIDSTECDSKRAELYRTDQEHFNAQARQYSIEYAQAI
ncbi:hypothetical protein I4U23_029783 [Adineta vaga]|nr:hypothetical protein I4U23_029783 [Adineta vaga]